MSEQNQEATVEAFKHGMRVMAGAVTIVTAGTGTDAAGLTATAVCSLSMEPPRLLVCLNKFGSTFARLAETGRFCVNLVAAQDRIVAERFAGRTGQSGADKFAGNGWVIETDAAPRLGSALAAISCSVHSVTVLETHAIVIGNVDAVSNGADGDPLVYCNQAFLTLRELA